MTAIGFSIYFTQQNRQLSADIDIKNAQIATLKRQQATRTTVTYLDIKEMGVKIKLSDDIKDAVYSYNASNPSALTAHISVQSLMGKDWCDLKSEPVLGSITEKKSLSFPSGETLTVNNSTVFQVGSSYFLYESPQSPCTQGASDQATEFSLLTAFKQALSTLQSDR